MAAYSFLGGPKRHGRCWHKTDMGQPLLKGREKETAQLAEPSSMLFAIVVAVVIAVTLEDHNLLVVSVPVVVLVPVAIVMPVLLYDYRFLSVWPKRLAKPALRHQAQRLPK
jgi:hypothetical protein